MVTILLTLQLAPPPCVAVLAAAEARALQFDLAGAATTLRAATGGGCLEAEIAAFYVGGLVDAREAFTHGASPEWLAPVRAAIAELERLSAGHPGQAEIARLLLQAAVAGAQSERDEMALYLEHAVGMESLQRAAGQPTAPVVSALETAGDLWLQVFRYDEARRFYAQAAANAPTPRALAGLGRAAARLDDAATACAAYRKLLASWGDRAALVPEVSDARTYLRQPACAAAVP